MVFARTTGFFQTAGAPPSGAITWGTQIDLTPVDGGTFSNSYSWAGVTGITGAEMILVFVQYNVPYPQRSNNLAGTNVTINGTACNVLQEFSYNTDNSKYSYAQAYVGWLASPTDGTVVFNSNSWSNKVVATLMPFDGAPQSAAAFGTLVSTTASAQTVTNLLTTTQANTSYRIVANQVRHHNGLPFTYNDTNLTELRSYLADSTSTGDEMTIILARALNGATGSYDMGGAFNPAGAAGDDRSSSVSLEVYPA